MVCEGQVRETFAGTLISVAPQGEIGDRVRVFTEAGNEMWLAKSMVEAATLVSGPAGEESNDE